MNYWTELSIECPLPCEIEDSTKPILLRGS